MNNAASGDPKYLSIKTSNAAIQARLLSLEGAADFLSICGFKPVPPPPAAAESLSIAPEGPGGGVGAAGRELLAAGLAQVVSAAANPHFGTL